MSNLVHYKSVQKRITLFLLQVLNHGYKPNNADTNLEEKQTTLSHTYSYSIDLVHLDSLLYGNSMHASYLIKRQQKSSDRRSDDRGDGSRTEDCGGYDEASGVHDLEVERRSSNEGRARCQHAGGSLRERSW